MLGSFKIIFLINLMLSTIKFDNEAEFMANKVCNIASDDFLSLEFALIYLFASELLPKDFFAIGLVFAECFCVMSKCCFQRVDSFLVPLSLTLSHQGRGDLKTSNCPFSHQGREDLKTSNCPFSHQGRGDLKTSNCPFSHQGERSWVLFIGFESAYTCQALLRLQ